MPRFSDKNIVVLSGDEIIPVTTDPTTPGPDGATNPNNLNNFILNNGNVGIGLSIGSATSKLQVSGSGHRIALTDSGDSDALRAVIGHIDSSGSFLQLLNDSTVTTALIRSYASSGVQAYFTAGNVGIGTNSPSRALTVLKDDPGNQAVYIYNSSATGQGMTVKGGAGSSYNILNLQDKDSNPRANVRGDGAVFFNSLTGSTGGSDARYNTSTKELFYDTSAKKYKKNIRDEVDSQWIHDIKVKTYDRKDGKRNDEVGIIADELALLKPDYACYNEHGEVESYSKSDLVPFIINELQKLTQRIGSLEDAIL